MTKGGLTSEVAVLAGVEIEHEIDERPLEPGALAGVAGEGAAAHPRGAFEIEEAQVRADIDVAARGGERRLFAPRADERDWPRHRRRRGRAGWGRFGTWRRSSRWRASASVVSWLRRAMSSPMARTWFSRSAVSSPFALLHADLLGDAVCGRH